MFLRTAPWLASLSCYLAFCSGIWSSLSSVSALVCPTHLCKTQPRAFLSHTCFPWLSCPWLSLDSSARYSGFSVTWLHFIFFRKLFSATPQLPHFALGTLTFHGYTTSFHQARADRAFFSLPKTVSFFTLLSSLFKKQINFCVLLFILAYSLSEFPFGGDIV